MPPPSAAHQPDLPAAVAPHGEGFRLRRVATDPAGSGDGAISPDGAYFVASSKRNGTVNLWIFDLRNGRWHQATRGAGDDIEGQWSPDCRRIVFTSTRGGHKQIWWYDVATGRIEQLTFGDHEEEYPSFAPDGQRILYVGGPWGHRYFYVVPASGGSPRAVDRPPGRAGAGSWAPDGRWLVCHSYDTGAGAIFLQDSEGAEEIQVTDGTAWDYKPTICPTRPVVAFSRSNEGRSVIWVQRLGDGDGRPLVTTGADDRWPTWTADGRSLFFHRLVDEGRSIGMWDRATGEVQELVGGHERPRYASFDPAGRRIVYASEGTGRSTIKILDLSDHALTALSVGEASFPAWSPTGARIAFCSRRGPAHRWQISTVDVATGKVHDWTSGVVGLRRLHGPLSWSPDGNRVLFKSETEPFAANIYELDLLTGGVSAVTDDSWWDEAAAYTPDGAAVIFMSTRGGDWTWGFYRKDLATGEIETLAGPDYVERNSPRLTRDGVLLSTLVAATSEELYEQRPDGTGRIVAAAGQGVRYPVPSADGRMVLFARTHRTVEYWLAENVWAADSPVADLARPLVARATGGTPISEQAPLGPVRSPVDTRRR
ncbi:peptidase S9 [Solwaraspora sp. WMMD406]|uniref:peptidase S9 n=1 Tax=Solwaraspora sp. WMMD406 TaxID=3016095 RepID=UPI0024162860|nr:peptidase S9 [Solwaraspora sp. WMMD406]MDG4763967.1 peptidase S9 [Solwaraspora sp. WMMD406]